MARQSRALPPVLLTRPEDRADRFADELRAAFGPDLVIVTSPLLTLTYLSPALPACPFAALIFTSESGVAAYQSLAVRPPATRAWCVGGRTAAAARAIGLDAQLGAGDAAALCRAIIAAGEKGPLLHLHGQDTRGDVAQTLTGVGIPTQSCTIYAQNAQPLSPDAQFLLSGPYPVLAPLFSPRTAAVLSSERARLALLAPLWIAALSRAVADAVVLQNADRIAISSMPESAALIRAIGTFLPASA